MIQELERRFAVLSKVHTLASVSQLEAEHSVRKNYYLNTLCKRQTAPSNRSEHSSLDVSLISSDPQAVAPPEAYLYRARNAALVPTTSRAQKKPTACSPNRTSQIRKKQDPTDDARPAHCDKR